MEQKQKEKEKKGLLIVVGGGDKEDPSKDEGGDSKLQYTLEDWGGYTPMELVSKMEEAKDAISKGNAREAMMALDSCIVRISGKKLDSEKESAVNPGYEYKLDKALS